MAVGHYISHKKIDYLIKNYLNKNALIIDYDDGYYKINYLYE